MVLIYAVVHKWHFMHLQALSARVNKGCGSCESMVTTAGETSVCIVCLGALAGMCIYSQISNQTNKGIGRGSGNQSDHRSGLDTGKAG